MREIPNEFASLDASLLKTKPTTMGRTSPFFFLMAMRFPPKKCLATSPGHCPAKSMLVKAANAETSSGPAILHPVNTFKWSGLKPSGPPDDPDGNDPIAKRTSDSEMQSEEA